MGSSSDIIFNTYHGGKFVTNERGAITYNGGETHVLETAPESLFTGMVSRLDVSFSSHRIWYKAPFEELKEAKIMYNGGDNFQRLCLVAIWTKMIQIYVEVDDVDMARENHGELVYVNQGHKDETGNVIPPVSEETQFEEEARIEAIVSQFVDEEEDGEDKNTPPCSDNEEEKNQCPYERWKDGSGELNIRQVFESVT
ncbi:hypothetical protein AALP_AA4G095700 [Arabis alpina]|uniref:Uncharacterized protein n=1 Tax=Arabis alpina TaxID=50452 RepID=A0A087H282_ARAAL|nr:hypothetical protein AALP_AA4G095700 [Arabis alpina]